MTRLLDEVEEMRRRLVEISASEQALVAALAEALSRVDQKLLSDVKRVTSEHEVRRGAILEELHTLAGRICSFPLIAPPAPEISPPPANGRAHPREERPPLSPGDWRRAAMSVDEELELHFGSRNGSY